MSVLTAKDVKYEYRNSYQTVTVSYTHLRAHETL